MEKPNSSRKDQIFSSFILENNLEEPIPCGNLVKSVRMQTYLFGQIRRLDQA